MGFMGLAPEDRAALSVGTSHSSVTDVLAQQGIEALVPFCGMSLHAVTQAQRLELACVPLSSPDILTAFREPPWCFQYTFGLLPALCFGSLLSPQCRSLPAWSLHLLFSCNDLVRESSPGMPGWLSWLSSCLRLRS